MPRPGACQEHHHVCDIRRLGKLVLQVLEGMRGFGGVVFAQASLAHLQGPAAAQTGCAVYTAPDYCIEGLSGMLA